MQNIIWGNENPEPPTYPKKEDITLCQYCQTNEVKDEEDKCLECQIGESEMNFEDR